MMRHDTPLRKQHLLVVSPAQGSGSPRFDGVGDAVGDAVAGALSGAEPRVVPGVDRPGAAVGTRVAAQVEWLPYGPEEADGQPSCAIVGTYGAVELEYAAIRRGAALLDATHRGTIRITGRDRIEFLNRMVTQELKGIGPGECRQSFWLNRKGRIAADLLIAELESGMWIDLDIHQARSTTDSLGEFLFSEDALIRDESAAIHRLSLHGPRAFVVLARAANRTEMTPLAPMQCGTIIVAGVEVVIARQDSTGEIGLELFMPRSGVEAVWEALCGLADGVGRALVRPIGWHAFNIARIEAGTPLFNVDFDTSCLPHETGVLRERVSFKKGCYLGQEVVARMESLGRPKQILVGLRITGTGIPVAGQNVHEREGEAIGAPVGTVTSSTASPMLGAASIALAMIRSAHAAIGNELLVTIEGERVPVVVAPLRFWPAGTP